MLQAAKAEAFNTYDRRSAPVVFTKERVLADKIALVELHARTRER